MGWRNTIGQGMSVNRIYYVYEFALPFCCCSKPLELLNVTYGREGLCQPIITGCKLSVCRSHSRRNLRQLATSHSYSRTGGMIVCSEACLFDLVTLLMEQSSTEDIFPISCKLVKAISNRHTHHPALFSQYHTVTIIPGDSRLY